MSDRKDSSWFLVSSLGLSITHIVPSENPSGLMSGTPTQKITLGYPVTRGLSAKRSSTPESFTIKTESGLLMAWAQNA